MAWGVDPGTCGLQAGRGVGRRGEAVGAGLQRGGRLVADALGPLAALDGQAAAAGLVAVDPAGCVQGTGGEGGGGAAGGAGTVAGTGGERARARGGEQREGQVQTQGRAQTERWGRTEEPAATGRSCDMLPCTHRKSGTHTRPGPPCPTTARSASGGLR